MARDAEAQFFRGGKDIYWRYLGFYGNVRTNGRSKHKTWSSFLGMFSFKKILKKGCYLNVISSGQECEDPKFHNKLIVATECRNRWSLQLRRLITRPKARSLRSGSGTDLEARPRRGCWPWWEWYPLTMRVLKGSFSGWEETPAAFSCEC